MEGFTPITILEWNDAKFPVFKMDKFVASAPNEQVAKFQFQCPEFIVWRKLGSLSRYYMVRKHAVRRLLTVLTNQQQKLQV